MKKQQIIIILAALIGTLAVAGVTVVLLDYLDVKQPAGNVQPEDTPPQEEVPAENVIDEDINAELNEKAKTIEQEAASLMETNPEEARAKYLEAEKAYQEAGNMQKLGEMRANAMTAEVLIQQKQGQVQ